MSVHKTHATAIPTNDPIKQPKATFRWVNGMICTSDDDGLINPADGTRDLEIQLTWVTVGAQEKEG